MSIIPEVGRKSLKMRLLVAGMYTVLAVLGVAMAYPFLMTLTASVSTAVDFNRYAPLSRSLWSREDRFIRGIAPYYPETVRGAFDHYRHAFPTTPATWTTWTLVGENKKVSDAFAKSYLDQAKDPKRWVQVQRMSADYADFCAHYPINDDVCIYDDRLLASFFREHYAQMAAKQPGADKLSKADLQKLSLNLLSDRWGVPIDDFFIIQSSREKELPLDQHGYWPVNDGRAEDFGHMARAYEDRLFLPRGIKNKWYDILQSPDSRSVLGLKGSGKIRISEFNAAIGANYDSFKRVPYAPANDSPKKLQMLWNKFITEVVPICEARPFPMKSAWLNALSAPDVRKLAGFPGDTPVTIDDYNRAFGTNFKSLVDTPFPVPADAPANMKAAYQKFVQSYYPARMIELKTTPAMNAAFRDYVKGMFYGDLKTANTTLKTHYNSWDDVKLSATMPTVNDAIAGAWFRFVDTLPYSTKITHSSEASYQQYLLKKHGSLAEVNRLYGTDYKNIELASPRFDMAYLTTFVKNERPLYIASLTQNYDFVLHYMLFRGRAVANTTILIALMLLASLTVNPLAAYALSRFQMRATPTVILFMLSTMAFPAAVSMIPGYLLMRDLHLLNTYAALILPSVANGMSIFLLKGFFDSLPPELYEAAALDGAPEWLVFVRITLPLSKPILAVIALGSFFAAYGSWEWAIIVCQKPQMWTLAVWLYQFNTTYASLPWTVMASFVLMSVPVFVVFLLCQNIILRGIILPQMK